MGTNIIRSMLLASFSVASTVVLPTQAMAEEAAYRIDIPAQSLGDALRSLGRVTRQNIVFDGSLVRGKRSVAVSGRLTASEALSRMLVGSGLAMARGQGGTLTVKAGNVEAGNSTEPGGNPMGTDAALGNAEIVVTGSRIRGVQTASPVLRRTQEEIRLSGAADLGDFARTLPQSFGGGQNPGVLVGASGLGNENVSSASSLNLRGLGPDATLTLLNGRRIAYNGVSQAVDISAIPVSALDRVEIMTDGASAIYGSDAVAGVANIMLKRSYDGIELSTRQAKATDGGARQQQYGILAGAEAEDAGFLVTYSYDRTSPVTAGQRSFTSATFPSYTLYPAVRHHNLLATGFWSPFQALTFSTDMVFSDRKSESFQPLSTNDYLDRGYRRAPENRSFAISPKVDLAISSDWRATAMATYAEDKISLSSEFYNGRALSFATIGSYTNRSTNFEANLEGVLANLPAGDLRVALGGGFRSNRLVADLQRKTLAATTPTLQFSESRSSYFAFGELAVPVIAADTGRSFIHSLSVSAAARYENYSGGMGDVLTPKLGLIFSPSAGVDFKLSWGRSYKTPTLYQQFLDYTAQLSPASSFAAAGYPATAAVLFLSGGNRNLKPERAETLTASIEIHPERVPGLRLNLGAFHIRYRNRLADPVSSLSGALTNPVYEPVLIFNPTAAQLSSIIAGAPSGLVNLTDYPYDAANVIAILDGRTTNIAAQTTKGVDAEVGYSFSVGDSSEIALSANATYLKSSRTLTPQAPTTDAAGVLFFPPHWRARAGASWTRNGLTFALFGNYVGGVTDARLPAAVEVGGMTTFDLSLRYKTGDGSSILDGLELGASILNLFNEKPDRIRTTAVYYPAYDSTNYSATGRLAAITIIKRFR